MISQCLIHAGGQDAGFKFIHRHPSKLHRQLDHRSKQEASYAIWPPACRKLRVGSGWRGLVVIVVGDVGNSDNENPHLAARAVNDAWWNMNERAPGDGLLNAIENDTPTAIQNVVKLGGSFVKMGFGSIYVNGMGPSRR